MSAPLLPAAASLGLLEAVLVSLCVFLNYSDRTNISVAVISMQVRTGQASRLSSLLRPTLCLARAPGRL